jgi:hypothetical protein
MGENTSAAAAGGLLDNAASPTRKHDRPTDLHTECRGCELGLSIDDNSHMCFTAAGPAFNRTRTSENTEISTQVILRVYPVFLC